MSFKAVFIVDEQRIPVLTYRTVFNKGADVTGRPCQRTVFSGLELTIKSQKEVNFVAWMTDRNLAKNVSLELIPNILGTRTRRIKLFDGYLTYWNQNFAANDAQPVSETLTIRAGGFEDSHSAGIYEAPWRVSYDEENTQATTIEEEKIFSRKYITNLDGEEIEKYKVGNTIFLCLETKNRIGDKVTINLNDPEYDFEHNGIHLKNDILKNYVISNDLEQIELKVIQQKETSNGTS